MKKLLYLFIPLTMISCDQDFLDVKPSSNTVVPTTLEDFQQLLDADFLRYTTELTELQTDDYYLDATYWQSMSNVVFKNSHVWADDIYETQESEQYGWNIPYQQIFYANVVLEGVEKIDPTAKELITYQHVKGSAYFIRAWATHQLLQLYAPAFDVATADVDLGVPIPMKSDVNEKIARLSNKACYEQVIKDLKNAVELLGETVDFGRPSKVAAWALLARVYLDVGEYARAHEASTNSLKLYNDLTDLNDLRIRDFKKTIYLTFIAPATIVRSNSNNTLISEELYADYLSTDLRKSIYFSIGNKGKPIKNSFHGLSIYCFSGLDTDEQYLIKAECEAHLDRVDDAMETLNYLLRHRIDKKAFLELSVSAREDALMIIRKERRKELLFRGVRWSDLKRYNRDGANITLSRELGNATYSLPPNSNRWLFPIPANEIKTSGIPQNDRKTQY